MFCLDKLTFHISLKSAECPRHIRPASIDSSYQTAYKQDSNRLCLLNFTMSFTAFRAVLRFLDPGKIDRKDCGI